MKWNDYKDLTVQLQVSPTAKIIHSGVHPGHPQLLAINGASMPVSSAAAAGAITNHLTQTWQQKRVSIKTLEGEFSVTMWASAADDEGKLRLREAKLFLRPKTQIFQDRFPSKTQ